jgi:hypothetical protein
MEVIGAEYKIVTILTDVPQVGPKFLISIIGNFGRVLRNRRQMVFAFHNNRK